MVVGERDCVAVSNGEGVQIPVGVCEWEAVCVKLVVAVRDGVGVDVDVNVGDNVTVLV